MTKKQILAALKRHGFFSGRVMSRSKTQCHRLHPENLVLFKAKIFTRRGLVLRGADLDITRDAQGLTSAAREAGENFYVLRESHPNPFWEPGSTPMRQVLGSATWWTRIRPEDQDVFLPVESATRRPKRVGLTCATGRWMDGPAYSVSCWDNDEFYNTNMVGAAVEIAGRPPKYFRVKKADPGAELSAPPSVNRGQPVRPVFYQRSGPLEYVWFNCGLAMPAVLYDNVVRPLNGLRFFIHSDHNAIHVRKDARVFGFIWPCDIGAPEVIASARGQLGLDGAHEKP